ncbi:uncharacterized protein TEOVI_000194400 [Trypanosoma equiperdum]|uniref:Uncharacterized protein n=2 Tax=Trypanozoon TaxID=39700 RepID=Q38D46_TRYB2|nr:hypothetical protein, unlikely [Trypanosoma brucei brucei TREU927]EAN77274.1 hypothetical protein, unlikely [Trypanosoma brucei brucei TREU927]SCU70371.1 hypothetical protein, conserved [Trypanosoma equiperdum]
MCVLIALFSPFKVSCSSFLFFLFGRFFSFCWIFICGHMCLVPALSLSLPLFFYNFLLVRFFDVCSVWLLSFVLFPLRPLGLLIISFHSFAAVLRLICCYCCYVTVIIIIIKKLYTSYVSLHFFLKKREPDLKKREGEVSAI